MMIPCEIPPRGFFTQRSTSTLSHFNQNFFHVTNSKNMRKHNNNNNINIMIGKGILKEINDGKFFA